MTRWFLPLCALLLVVLLCAASLAGVAEARHGGRIHYPGTQTHGIRRNHTRSANGAACSRGLSGGTWTACLGSSLLAAAAMLL